jgi:putative transcriptional regulator
MMTEQQAIEKARLLSERCDGPIVAWWMARSQPNRRRPPPAVIPPPATVRAVRLWLGLTQTDAAESILATLRAWQRYEAGERQMTPLIWESFLVRWGLFVPLASIDTILLPLLRELARQCPTEYPPEEDGWRNHPAVQTLSATLKNLGFKGLAVATLVGKGWPARIRFVSAAYDLVALESEAEKCMRASESFMERIGEPPATKV